IMLLHTTRLARLIKAGRGGSTLFTRASSSWRRHSTRARCSTLTSASFFFSRLSPLPSSLLRYFWAKEHERKERLLYLNKRFASKRSVQIPNRPMVRPYTSYGNVEVSKLKVRLRRLSTHVVTFLSCPPYFCGSILITFTQQTCRPLYWLKAYEHSVK